MYLITARTEAEAEGLMRDVTGEDSDSLYCLLGEHPRRTPLAPPALGGVQGPHACGSVEQASRCSCGQRVATGSQSGWHAPFTSK